MLRSRSALLGLFALVAGLGLGAYWLTTRSGDDGFRTSVTVADALGSDTTGYRRATEGRDFAFPEDHGPHPDYKNEWWYLTGNLQGPDGQRYGYELTIFRFALAPPDSTTLTHPVGSRRSAWRTNQSYMAHFAVTDEANETFHAAERFARGGAGLAGAQAVPFRVWLEDWSMTSTGDEPFPVRLRAQTSDAGIDLTVRPEKPVVLQGNRGRSQKGPGPGNASYYYSYTRLSTRGILRTDADTVQVSGSSWMDREWSTSALGPNQVGWDWFSLQLEDGRDLMYYQIRNENGSASRFSEGTIVDPDGSTRPIRRDDVTIEVLDSWTSPDGTHTYPVEWMLRIPSENLSVRIIPLLPNQELIVSVRYWEGAVKVENADGRSSGRGYVEMTGYGSSPASPTS